MADQAAQARGRRKLRCLAKLVVVSGTAFRNSIRAHAGAGCLAVAGIAGLGTAYLIPFIIRASSKGFRDAAVSTALILVGTVSFAVVVWLLVYLPMTALADAVTTRPATRLWLAALFCTAGIATAALFFMFRYDQPPHILARSFLLVGGSRARMWGRPLFVSQEMDRRAPVGRRQGLAELGASCLRCRWRS